MKRFRGDDDGRVDVAKADRLDMDPVWDGMPLEDFQRFAAYIRAVADALRLREWTIRLRLRPEDEGDIPDEAVNARIKVGLESRFATVGLAHGFASEPRRVQEGVLLHEVLHIYFEQMLLPMVNNLTDLVGTAHARTMENWVGTEKERTIDALAQALRKRMPRLKDC